MLLVVMVINKCVGDELSKPFKSYFGKDAVYNCSIMSFISFLYYCVAKNQLEFILSS